MAITLQPYHRPATLRTPLVRRQPTEPTGVLAGLMLTLVLFGVTTALLVTQAAGTPVARASAPEPLAIFQSKTMVASSSQAQEPAPEAVVSAEATAAGGVAPVGEPAPAAEAAPDPMVAQAGSQAGPVTPEPPVPSDGLAAGAQARVANTDGMGVVLHDAPRKGARRPSGLLEGAKVTVLGMSGGEWVQVRAAGRPDGWVPAAYLAPIDEHIEQ